MKFKKSAKYFLRYLIAFSVPILCMAILLLYNDVSNRYASTQKDALGQLTQAGAQIDWFSAKMQSTALHMSGNDRLVSLDAASFDPTTYTATKIFGLLRSYESNLPADVSMLFYLRGGKNIYANQKFFPYEDFIVSEDYEPELGQADLYLSLNSVASKRLVGISNDTNSTRYCAAIFYPVPEIAENPRSTVCFLISRSYAEKMIQQYFPNMNACVFVMDNNGNTIYNSASHLYSETQMQKLMQSNVQAGVMSLDINGERYILLRSVSSNTGVNYAVFIPRTIFYKSNAGNAATLTLLVVIMLILSVLTALSLVRSYYNSMIQADRENAMISAELSSRNNLMQEMVLRRLLRGTIENDDSQTLNYNLTCADLHFIYPDFVVVFCMFYDLTISDIIFAQIMEQLKNTALESAQLYPVQLQDNNGIAAIINCNGEQGDRIGYLELIYDALTPLYLHNFSIGCGRIHHSAFKIDNSYVEAVVSVSEKLNPQTNGCFLYGEKPEYNDEKSYQYPYAEQALIEQSIKNGNAEIAIHSVLHVLEKIENMEQSMLIQKCLKFDIINMVVKVAASINQPLSTTEISQLSSWDTTKALKEHLCTILQRLVDVENETKKKQQVSIKYALINYMQEHFKENDLSLDRFATEFGLSYAYISKVFKEETGRPFLSYLTQLRFRHIKQQLIDTDLPIKEIITKAGYNDLTNFMRKFKSTEGVTPGQYRQEQKQSPHCGI
ncbi:MAG: helix-turn-helix transcriptional regulator [Ruminococcaceae bacterium]|nr:helix-turn-helix transcriptional regulator [Oscillospiraceae bacterium]